LFGRAAYMVRRRIGYYVLFHLGRSRACAWQDIHSSLRQDLKHAEAQIAPLCCQIADDQGYGLWQTPKGNFWVPSENGKNLPYWLAHLEGHIDRQGCCRVRPGDIVLDCGAHVGLFVREAIAAGASVVVAIEPAPENIACLRRTFPEELRTGRVIICPKGVWDKEDVLSFQTDARFSAGDRVVLAALDNGQSQQIPVTTIDRLVAELGLQRVDFIKLHVEGCEAQAIAGARETIAKFRPRLAIAADHQDDDAERIPELVRAAWPSYQMRSRGCHIDRKRLLILPDMLFLSQ
jgi:FkbM family methyltransferase